MPLTENEKTMYHKVFQVGAPMCGSEVEALLRAENERLRARDTRLGGLLLLAHGLVRDMEPRFDEQVEARRDWLEQFGALTQEIAAQARERNCDANSLHEG